ncbi:hypothetical protein [Maribellus maritimus]|uniref:hypothetical protein n=1 Tax=Maribellus maritimus TaxID=2870838 RepID=UPI001EEA9DFD|nr:hypothetical protein [Maribellus maritimus]MCG6186026.1 hypothetical protein [Maribellus maritimus]
MKRRDFIHTTALGSIAILGLPAPAIHSSASFTTSARQITNGPLHHLFGYIGQSLTIPWNSTGKRLLTLSSPFIDHLPDGGEPAGVCLVHLDKPEGKYYKIEKVDESLGWNPQQGTMFYWNPDNAANQFFFNDRDKKTGKVFTALFDISKNKRVYEYKFNDTPVGNSGVCPKGKTFLAINYARMARLRAVTGYKGATDWTEGARAPKDDGIFKIDIQSGKKDLLVSFATLEAELQKKGFDTGGESLFINHTLWNRDGKLFCFFVRAGWKGTGKEKRTNVFCTMNSDGTGLHVGRQFIGGHPEWGIGQNMIGRIGDDQVIFDIINEKIVGKIGTPEAIPNPEGDISLSPDGNWFVNGSAKDGKNFYNIIRLKDGEWTRSEGIDKGEYSGDVRIDSAPRWNRENNQVLVQGITDDGTEQLFIITIK